MPVGINRVHTIPGPRQGAPCPGGAQLVPTGMASIERETAAPDAARLRRDRRQVAAWLFCICFMLLVMIALGGATRLTGSGLSIMEWAPVSGMLPPMNEADWTRLFDLYRQIPQYNLLHAGMGLAGFKGLFWLEWVHRLWGRLLGFAFLVPLLWFWMRGALERRFLPWLVAFFLLGGLQGAVGWFMVESGFLPDSTAVSAYRLVVHLCARFAALCRHPVDRADHPRAPAGAARRAARRRRSRAGSCRRSRCSCRSPSSPAASWPAPMRG